MLKIKNKTLIILIIVTMSIATFLSLFFVMSTKVTENIERKQQEYFYKTVDTIQTLFEKEASYTQLKKFEINGFIITVIGDNGEIIYPSDTIKTDDFNYIYSDSSGLETIFYSNSVAISVRYPLTFSREDVLSSINQAIPTFIGAMFLIMTVNVSLYYLIEKNEQKKMNKLFEMLKDNVSSEALNNENLKFYLKENQNIYNEIRKIYIQLEESKIDLMDDMVLLKKLEKNNITLLRSITHEMKTPLMSIRLLMTRLSNKGMTTPNRQNLSKVNQQFQILERLIKELLFINKRKISQEVNSRINLTSLVHEILLDYQLLIEEKKLQIQISEDKKDTFFYFDPLLLKKILSNLISNSLIYCSANSTIDLSLSAEKFTIKNIFSNPEKINAADKFSGLYNSTGMGIYLVKIMLLNTDYEIFFKIKKNSFLCVINHKENDLIKKKSHI